MNGLLYRLEDGKNILDIEDFLIGDQDVCFVKLALHVAHVGSHVGRQKAALEHEAFFDIDLNAERLRLLRNDDAVLAHFVDAFGDLLANDLITRRNGGNVCGLLVRLDGNGVCLHGFDGGFGGALDATANCNGVGSCGDAAQADAHQLVGEERCSGGSVAYLFVSLAGNLANHFRAHLLDRVGEIDILRNGNAVVGNRRRPVLRLLRLQSRITAFGAKGNLDGLRQFVNARSKAAARVDIKCDFF